MFQKANFKKVLTGLFIVALPLLGYFVPKLYNQWAMGYYNLGIQNVGSQIVNTALTNKEVFIPYTNDQGQQLQLHLKLVEDGGQNK